MLNRHGWKFVARDALALYALSYLIRVPSRAILGLPEALSVPAQLFASALVFVFGVLSFGVVAFYTRNEVWKHLVAVSATLSMVSAAKYVVSISLQQPELSLIRVIPAAVTLPLIYYSIVMPIGGYIGLTFKNRSKDKRAAS